VILLDKAIKYAEDVIEGKEITTWEVKAQCRFFLNDYNNRQYSDDFQYYFDEEELEVINNLLKLMNFATGFVAKAQVLESLANFQAFLIVNVFGWRYKKNPKRSRYRDVNLFIARKNAKSSIVSIIFILLMLTEQQYSEFYSICLTRDLAAELKKAMEQVISASPLIKKHFKVSASETGRITCKLTGSFFEPRVNQAGKNNSIRASAFVGDEYGNFSEISNFNAMRSGQKSVLNPIAFKTTTAYEINNSIMETEDLPYIRDLLNGVKEDERTFSLIYYAEKEHIYDDIGMMQASPLRIEENYEEVRNNRKLALNKPSALGEYITKDMNVFIQEDKEKAYIDMEFWNKSVVKKIDFSGKDVVVALDGSISYDLFAITIAYREENKYYMKSHAFLPSGTLNKRREKIDYKDMERRKYCTIHDADTVQYNLVEEYIRNIEIELDCKIKAIVSDPYCMKQTMESLAKDYTVIPLIQSYNYLTVATTEFRNEVYNNNLYHEENKLYDWCVANTTLNEGKAGHIMVAKDKAKKNKRRIDMCATSVMVMTELIKDKKKKDFNKIFNENYMV
jgi:phage terminase large subunit-like protein